MQLYLFIKCFEIQTHLKQIYNVFSLKKKITCGFSAIISWFMDPAVSLFFIFLTYRYQDETFRVYVCEGGASPDCPYVNEILKCSTPPMFNIPVAPAILDET